MIKQYKKSEIEKIVNCKGEELYGYMGKNV